MHNVIISGRVLLLFAFVVVTGLLIWETNFSQDTRSKAFLEKCKPGQRAVYVNSKITECKVVNTVNTPKDIPKAKNRDALQNIFCKRVGITEKCNNGNGTMTCEINYLGGSPVWGDCKVKSGR